MVGDQILSVPCFRGRIICIHSPYQHRLKVIVPRPEQALCRDLVPVFHEVDKPKSARVVVLNTALRPATLATFQSLFFGLLFAPWSSSSLA